MAHLSYQWPAGRQFSHQDDQANHFRDLHLHGPHIEMASPTTRGEPELLRPFAEADTPGHEANESRSIHEIILMGGSPWGFSLKGGSEMRSALIVSKVEPSGKAGQEGSLRIGDLVVSVNKVRTESRTQAIQLVQASGSTLSIVVARVGSALPSDRVYARTYAEEPAGPPRAPGYETPSIKQQGSPLSASSMTRLEHLENDSRKTMDSPMRSEDIPPVGSSAVSGTGTGAGRLKYGLLNDMMSMSYTPLSVQVDVERTSAQFTPVRKTSSPVHRSHHYRHPCSPERVPQRPRESLSSPNLSSSQDDRRSPSPPPIPPRPRFLGGNHDPAFRSLQYIPPPSKDKMYRPVNMDVRLKTASYADTTGDRDNGSGISASVDRGRSPVQFRPVLSGVGDGKDVYDPLSSDKLREHSRAYQSLHFSPRSGGVGGAPLPDVLAFASAKSTPNALSGGSSLLNVSANAVPNPASSPAHYTANVANNRYEERSFSSVAAGVNSSGILGRTESVAHSSTQNEAHFSTRSQPSYIVHSVRKYENLPPRESSQDSLESIQSPRRDLGVSTPSSNRDRSLLNSIQESPSSSASFHQRASPSVVTSTNAPMLRHLSEEFGVQSHVRPVQETNFPLEETTFPVHETASLEQNPENDRPPPEIGHLGNEPDLSDARFKASRTSMRKAFGIFEEFNPRRKSDKKKQAKRGKSKEELNISAEPVKTGDGSLRRVASETFTPMKDKKSRENSVDAMDDDYDGDDFGFNASYEHNREQNLSDPARNSSMKRSKTNDEKRSSSDPMRKSFKSKIVRRKGDSSEEGGSTKEKRQPNDKKGRVTPTPDRPDKGPFPETKHVRSVSLDFIPKKSEMKRRSIGEVPSKHRIPTDKLPSPMESHMSVLCSDSVPTIANREFGVSSADGREYYISKSQERDLHKMSLDLSEGSWIQQPVGTGSQWHRYADVSRLSISREPDALRSPELVAQVGRKRIPSVATHDPLTTVPTRPNRLASDQNVKSLEVANTTPTNDPQSSDHSNRFRLQSVDRENPVTKNAKKEQRQHNDDIEYANQLRLQAKRLGKQQGVASLRLNTSIPTQKSVAVSKPVKPADVYRSRPDSSIIEYFRSPSKEESTRTYRSSEDLHDLHNNDEEPSSSRPSTGDQRRNSQSEVRSNFRRSLVIESHPLDDSRRPASTLPSMYGGDLSSERRPLLKERMITLSNRQSGRSDEDLRGSEGRRSSRDELEMEVEVQSYRRSSQSNEARNDNRIKNEIDARVNHQRNDSDPFEHPFLDKLVASQATSAMDERFHSTYPVEMTNGREEAWNNLRNEVENRRSQAYFLINNNNNTAVAAAAVTPDDKKPDHDTGRPRTIVRQTNILKQNSSSNEQLMPVTNSPNVVTNVSNLQNGAMNEEQMSTDLVRAETDDDATLQVAKEIEKPLRQVPDTVLEISHRRQRSNDEIECDIAIESLSKDLAPVVSLPVKVEYRDSETPVTVECVTSSEWHPVTSLTNTSPKSSVLAPPPHLDVELGRASPDTLAQKKSELLSRIQTKVDIMKSARESLKADIMENEKLGSQITSIIEAKPLTAREFDKYKSYISELDKIMNLLLKIAGRLARAENAVLSVSKDVSESEKEVLISKRDRLKEQHEDAKKLREGIERRSTQVSTVLQAHLTEEEFNEYVYFVRRKTELIKEEQEIVENIDLGEEQLKALRMSMSHSQDVDFADYY